MNAAIICSKSIIHQTLASIRAGGAENKETLVLWLGRKTGTGVEVIEAFTPPQQAEFDRFYVPPEAMRTIMRRLRERRAQICVQVHSHPGLAFHSEADDAWALIRHCGALSLVVPYFGAKTTVEGFLDSIAAYALSAEDQWEEVPRNVLAGLLEVQDADG